MRRFRRIVLAVVCGICLGTLVLDITQFVRLYRDTTGLVFENGNPVGGDFPCFYLAGRFFREDRTALYDHARQFAAQQELFAGDKQPGLLPFVYPPLIAALFAPLSRLPYYSAALIWLTLGAAIGAIGVGIAVRASGLKGVSRVVAILLAASFTPLTVYTLAGGQLSVFGLLTAALFSLFLLRGRERLAGIALWGSYYKPPLFLFFVLFQILSGRRRVLLPFFAGVAGLFLLSVLSVGFEGIERYISAARHYGHGVEVIPGYVHRAEQGSGVRSLLLTLFADRPLIADGIFACFALAVFVAVCRMSRTLSTELRLALELSASLTLSPWLMHYDYALLVVPMLLVLPELLEQPLDRSRIPLALSLALLYWFYSFPVVALGEIELRTAPIFLVLWLLSLLHFAAKGSTADAEASRPLCPRQSL